MENKITPFGYFLIISFFVLLAYASSIYTKSIDWDVLKRMENAPLTLPTIDLSATASPSATKK